MSFGSPIFVFLFMPIAFTLYYAIPASFSNILLLCLSLTFYCFDAGALAVILVGSVAVNHLIALKLDVSNSSKRRRILISVGVISNIIPLLYYKYSSFILETSLLATGYSNHLAIIKAFFKDVTLPAGISFFTFQGISYIVDVYRREIRPAARFSDFGMYHTLFPQLIAGPIVRFAEIETKVVRHPASIDDIYDGIIIFCLGLATKIILADNIAVVADHSFSLEPSQNSVGSAWLGLAAYTLQIFSDFSGYSAMAIGMGRMLGFSFPQNFDQPYRSRSITEFWRRWHITLSRWFRDYLYIPLGGNRNGSVRTYLNLFVVFMLCGLWHGAALTFLVWGLWHGTLLVLERLAKNLLGWQPAGWIGWAGTIICVMVGWVFFRAPTLEYAIGYLAAMAGMYETTFPSSMSAILANDKLVLLALGLGLALIRFNPSEFRSTPDLSPWKTLAVGVFAISLFVYSTSIIAADGFNPFIYFRF